MRILFQPHSVPNRVLSLHHLQWQRAPHAEQHEERPLPPERVDHYAEHKPVDQLRIGEEVEGSGWCPTLDEFGHVDPFLHPIFVWPC